MKNILIIIMLIGLAAPAFAAVDTWFNTNPYKKYDKSIQLQKIHSDVYDKDGIKIEKICTNSNIHTRKVILMNI